MRLAARALAVTTALLAAASLARGDAPSADAYVGRWRYADGEEGRRRVDQAVDDAVAGLPFFLEPMAEDRVEERVGPFSEIRISLDGDRLTFAADDWGPVTSRLGGPAVSVRGPAGSELSMSQRLEGNRLIQVFEHADGTRRNELALSGDGDVLWLRVSIASPQLPHDAEYRLRYRRVGGAPQPQASR